MYGAVLAIHSWLRWAALLLGAAATLAAIGDRADATERSLAGRLAMVLMLAVDLQVLFGLMLYFGLSPLTKEALNNVGGAIHNGVLRFWAMEHLGAMTAAVTLVHVGRVLALTATTRRSRQTRRAICFGAAVLLMIAASPWPGMANGRPLFRI